MIAVVIVESILLLFLIPICLILYRVIRKLFDVYAQREQESDNFYDFSLATYEYPQSEIAQCFEDVLVFCYINKDETVEDTVKIVDTSNYIRKNLIGIIYLVQPQAYDEMTQKIELSLDSIKEAIRRRYPGEGIDWENDAIQEAIHRPYAFFPHSTVYQLKDGNWLWRSGNEN